MTAPRVHDHQPHADARIDAQWWWRWRCTPECGWPSRAEALHWMQQAGVPVVPWGAVSDLVAQHGEGALAVGYTNPWLHMAGGKERATLAELRAAHGPELLSSLFVGPPGLSLRLLAIGGRRWLLRYAAEPGQWASNDGDEGSIDVWPLPGGATPEWAQEGGPTAQLEPIWGVDLVAAGPLAQAWLEDEAAWQRALPQPGQGERGDWAALWAQLWACDLNLAPGIQGTGLHMTLGGSVSAALAEPGVRRPAAALTWANPES